MRHQESSLQRALRLRRLAIQLAAQLPEEEPDALEVLDLTKALVREFLHIAVSDRPSLQVVAKE